MTAFANLFGNNDAAKQAKEARQLQAVTNDNQIAAVNRENAAVGLTRKAPRGRRLFEEGPDAGAPAAKSRKLGGA